MGIAYYFERPNLTSGAEYQNDFSTKHKKLFPFRQKPHKFCRSPTALAVYSLP